MPTSRYSIPSYRLCTLSSKDAKLTMEIGVEQGRGYVMADRQRNVEHMIGLIPLDSIFSPIRKVNFTVDDTRVGQSVDYDRLTVELETNGSITPDDALSTAASIMQEELDLFVSFTNRAEPLPERRRTNGTFRSRRSTCRCARSTVSSARASRKSPNCSI